VITDRYVDSSLAYQGGGRGLEEEDIRRLSRWATGGLAPDLTVLLDLDAAVGLARTTGPGDRLEAEEIAFHERVRHAFRELARRGRNRYLVIDVTDTDPAAVLAQVLERLGPELPAVPAHPPVGVPLTMSGEAVQQ
jgi:dTMP kinase